MAKVLVTGMSGTGKSTALQILSARGHRTVDTDTDRWSHWVTLPDGSTDWVWRDDAISTLLAEHLHGSLFVAGCRTNQGLFYAQFDHVALLNAPADVLLARIAATVEIDASTPIADVVQQLELLYAGVWRQRSAIAERGTSRVVILAASSRQFRRTGPGASTATMTSRRHNANAPADTQDGDVADARFPPSQPTRYHSGLLPAWVAPAVVSR